MRTLLAALTLAKLQERTFTYIWPMNHKFSAHLNDAWGFRYRCISTDFSWVTRNPDVKFHDEHIDDLEAVAREREVWIRTLHGMRHPSLKAGWRKEFRALKPVPEVERRVRATWSKGLGDAPYVGVMIRAHPTAPPRTLQRSPVSWYLERMQGIVDRFPGIGFFLSADTPEVHEAVLKRFERVIVQDDKGVFNAAAGIQAAAADLYLLASASFVLQPYWSSFPEMARALADRRVGFVHSLSDGEPATACFDLPPPADPLRPFARA
ncbi:hypothetical protein GCM10028812_14440 [Ancylobacter sonchi]